MEGSALYSYSYKSGEPIMIKSESTRNESEEGFTLVELMVTMVAFLLVITAASGIFTGLLTQFKQQSKMAETNTEGIIGLEILRRDIGSAGYGLPWAPIPLGIAYTEAANAPANTYNDCPGACNPPRAIFSGDNVNFNNILSGTDYLVIKAVNVAANSTCLKWTYLNPAPFSIIAPGNPRMWDATNSDAFNAYSANGGPPEYVTVLSMGSQNSGIQPRQLIPNGAAFFTTYTNVTTAPWPPTNPYETRLVYGISDNTNLTTLRMPFNRADYFVYTAANSVPTRCAPNTGVLEKAVVSQKDGSLTYLPLLDCVADMQVKYMLDTDGDGIINWQPPSPADDLTITGLNLAAADIRAQVKEVRVYIVAHEGQRDINYDFSMNGTRKFLSATIINPSNSNQSIGVNFVDLSKLVGNPEYKYYRWKLYTVAVKPQSF